MRSVKTTLLGHTPRCVGSQSLSELCRLFQLNSNLFNAMQLFYAYRHATLTA